jgi:hypothetical protein
MDKNYARTSMSRDFEENVSISDEGHRTGPPVKTGPEKSLKGFRRQERKVWVKETVKEIAEE